jgi:hypothetical protein
MITKTATEFVKEAIVGTILGAVRAADLTPKEKKALKEHYNLPDTANLTLRNAGRGALTDFIPIPGVNWLAGYFNTKKYSRGNAQKIMQEKGK